MQIRRTTSADTDFIQLVSHLDRELAVIDGDDHAFYHQYNKIDNLSHCVVIYDDDVPVGCGAFKEFKAEVVEIKRMYVSTAGRSRGTGTLILKELEKWAWELGYKKTVLETGKRQQDAVALYSKNEYKLIPNYGQYQGIENSVCFEKEL